MPRKKGGQVNEGDLDALVDNRDPEDIMMDMEGVPLDIKRKAIWLRHNMSSLERRVWLLLGRQDNPWGMLRQYPKHGYYIDFYASSFGVALEIDGPDHADRVEEDAARDGVLLGKGIRTIRLTPGDLDILRGVAFYDYLRGAIEETGYRNHNIGGGDAGNT